MTNTYEKVAEHFLRLAEVETGRMFGAEGLKVLGKVFAMEVKGKLVIKVPARRAAELAFERGIGLFDPGHGKLMKEWLQVSRDAEADWLELAQESFAYIKTLQKT
jgi:hypothetical protein